MNIKKIYLASPRGFCAGVSRAIHIVDTVLKKHGKPIYIRHQIVHNDHIIKDYEKKGVKFIEQIEDAPRGSIVIFSAHGSSPELYIEAKKRNLTIYDATCPLVKKVHLEAKRYEKEGYYIVYIGQRNHPETVGVMSEVNKNSIILIDSILKVKELIIPLRKKAVILTQTTLSLNDTKQIIKTIQKKYPEVILPPASDICFSTQNRQNAVKELSKKVKIIFVVGSKTSSNSNKLHDTAIKQGAKAFLINNKTDINLQLLNGVSVVGVTAGASAPEILVDDVIKFLSNKATKVEEIVSAKELLIFPLPINI
ncbi:MAG: 4-hydroxy-3-methylbut-2-enyl diphosphate reductase [bacterium]|nr:4-hydroxy-3-methylbut-2-enyl diphosphate reductase [bacterium]